MTSHDSVNTKRISYHSSRNFRSYESIIINKISYHSYNGQAVGILRLTNQSVSKDFHIHKLGCWSEFNVTRINQHQYNIISFMYWSAGRNFTSNESINTNRISNHSYIRQPIGILRHTNQSAPIEYHILHIVSGRSEFYVTRIIQHRQHRIICTFGM